MIWIVLADLSKYREARNGKLITEISQTGYDNIVFRQQQIVDYVKHTILDKAAYRIIFGKPNMDDVSIKDITENDIVLWHPNVASSNLDFVKRFQHSIVLLQAKTVLIQKESVKNPVTENMAVNHGFYIMYLDESDKENTNAEWSMVVNQDSYLITHERFSKMLDDNKTNIQQ